jgi:phage gp46-like protein
MDFALEIVDGRPQMTESVTNTILNEIILSLMIKAQSVAVDSKGKPVYPGSWWFDPSFGSNIYEITTTTPQNVNLAAEYAKKALKWIVDAGLGSRIDVVSRLSTTVRNCIEIDVDAVQPDGTTITYTYFREVS